ncbi:class I SAM-dependent DNA methyltransferase [Planococcus kocurii]|uniref:Methyltransferase n=2 Tax=Planococcus TaxID=1372 RepID=A0ABM5WX61_9BACL|nr:MULTISPECIES: class I SAM-dependent methyltransferase [Planococcus]ALS78924.1 methyltransferase [Planococcus kocurii]AQU79118.1 SAM-dependent methyltransferase [Planococcus faecalis]KAA0957790.1 class I SAM-dependent methyltransferase [Planococcus sp. ANT_H30]OHX51752.1 methyltransferase [Planococcus faecalis]
MKYGKFAAVYDGLMEDIPYEKYVEWVASHVASGKLLDVACGTGTLSQLFAEMGYNVTASDLSEDMLTIANQRFQDANQSIPVLQLSMDNLEGLTDFDIVTIAIDSVNYLQDEQQVQQTFKEVYEALNVGGHFFFDVHSIVKVDKVYMASPFVYDAEEIAYIWHTEPGEAEHSVIHDMTFFVRHNELFERFEETHEQRTFSVDAYTKWLEAAGFSVESVTADFSDQVPDEESERIFFYARKV